VAIKVASFIAETATSAAELAIAVSDCTWLSATEAANIS
jgi:hypothetical protein